MQRLAIAMEPGTYVRPHRHPHTFELLTSLTGRFLVLNFDDLGNLTQRVVLGEDCKVLEMDAGTWHTVLSLDEGGVIFEVNTVGTSLLLIKMPPHGPPPKTSRELQS